LPAAALAGTGSILAWLVGAHAWVTGLAILPVIGAWAWIVWQTVQTRRRPAASTLYVMAAATALVAMAVLWPLIEPHLARALMV
jgi:predicted negative regulator of RcsB-dependent stress response